MTIQAFVFLRTLKRVQRSEGLSVKVDPFWGFISTYGCERNFVIDKDLRKKRRRREEPNGLLGEGRTFVHLDRPG